VARIDESPTKFSFSPTAAIEKTLGDHTLPSSRISDDLISSAVELLEGKRRRSELLFPENNDLA